MFSYFAEYLTSFFVAKKYIGENERAIYNYSFELLLACFFNFIVLFAIAFISNTVGSAVAFVIGFIPLRMMAGGYHAKNHSRCMETLVVVYLLCVALLKFYPYDWMWNTSILFGVITGVVVFKFAPVEDKNHPLEKEQICELKMKSRRCVCSCIGLICITLFILKETVFSFSISLGCLTVALSIYVSAKIQKRSDA